MAEGVFQTDRMIFDNPIWKNPAKFRLFFYIYGNAIFLKEGYDISGIHLERGQLLKSYRSLADDLEYIENHAIKKYSISHIKKLVHELIKEKRIKLEVLQLGTLFTVLNYEQYQGFERFEKDNREQSENAVRTERERSENNNNKDKNVKKEKKNIIYAHPMNYFEQFWNAYPKKKSKGQAEKAWSKFKVDEQFLQIIIIAIERAKKSTEWKKDNGQFIPYPATWLNAKGWEDATERPTVESETLKGDKYEKFYL